MRVLAPVLIVALLTTACGEGRVAPSLAAPDPGRVSFVPETETVELALLTGVLGGDPATGCLWLGHGDERIPLALQEDTAVLDGRAQPPVVRDGDTVLAAFGDRVELGGGSGGEQVPGCPAPQGVFTGHGLRRALPGELPKATLTDVRRTCGSADGPAVAGRLVVEGVPRLPLQLEVLGPDGAILGRSQLPAAEGEVQLFLDLADPFAPLPEEWNVIVSEGAQFLAQALIDPRPGDACG